MSGPGQVLDHSGSVGGSAIPLSMHDEELAAALQLGWRVAELYAHVNDPGEPTNDNLLPAHAGLKPEDQLELQLRAAAGDARRAGADAQAGELEALVPAARRAPKSPEAAEAFRSEIRCCHIELAKQLWAGDEALGQAYELGNGMSDTYSRVSRSYSQPGEDPKTAWENVFAADRVERLKRYLDDLQSRLNPRGVAVVRHHLDVWRDNVRTRIATSGEAPAHDKVRDGLRRQTIIWRQLISADKQPEAYLNSEARAELRGDLLRLMWRRCRFWLIPGVVAVFAIVAFLPQIIDWYDDNAIAARIGSGLIAVAGAVGLTRASMLAAVRSRLTLWSGLLWDRAVAQKVSEKTLVLDDVFTPPTPGPHSFAAAAEAVREKVPSRPRALARTHGPSPTL